MSDFRSASQAAHREGFTYFDQLGSRQVDGGFELWLRVLDPTTFESRVIKGQIVTADVLGDLSVADFSVADLWAGAKWAEAEIAVDFRRAASRLTSSGESPHLERRVRSPRRVLMDDSKSGTEAMGLRGTIALDPIACTSCLVCIRDCPTKCMSLTSHVEERQEGGRRPTKINILDAFEIDFGLCIYCGICVDVCPHEALFWSPTPTASESGPRARERLIYNIEGLEESLVGVIRPVVSDNS